MPSIIHKYLRRIDKLQGEKKTALEVEAKQKGQNEALLKRERGLRKNESGLKLRFQKENEILTVREFDVQHREDQMRKDNKINFITFNPFQEFNVRFGRIILNKMKSM